MKFGKLLTIVCSVLFFAVPASGQFYLSGVNPASTKWYSIESNNYKIIYPSGIDSLARVYAVSLEKYRIPVSRTVNYIPGEYSWNKTPVVLHPYNAYSNGSVAWAPKRMDFYTSPQAYGSEPMPWVTMLSIHESRHVAQMQFGLSHVFRPFNYIFGEMFNGAATGLYANRWLLEGDAVTAETGLSNSGRGRSAEFLNYYRIAFDHGDYRNYDRWAYGSYKHYTPDYYAFGYMLLSGIRYTYDIPDFSGQLFRRFAKRPYDLSAKNNIVRKVTGEKDFYAAADSARTVIMDIWAKDAESRAPFLQYEDLSRLRGNYTTYSANIFVKGDLYTIKESFDKSRRLVKIDSTGKEKVIGSFAGEVSMLYYSPVLDKIIWTETVPDKRWTQKYNSVLRTLDPKTGRKKSLTLKGRLFNPNPSMTDSSVTVTEYTDDGRSQLVVIDGVTGEKTCSYNVPDSLQLVESASLGDRIFATAISEGGYGIYRLETENESYDWKSVLVPSPVKVVDIGTYENWLTFMSDRTGTEEFYFFNPDDGTTVQATSLRYGGCDFTFDDDGAYLYCSVHEHKGSKLARIDADSLLYREVDFFDRYIYPVAEKLSEQERRLAASVTTDAADESFGGADAPIQISSPKRYRKAAHALNVHSWAPVYFNYDNISNQSFDHYYDAISLGATALFQNLLSDFYGQIGYSAHKDPDDKSLWRHSGHLNLTYCGWYPVFELKLDFNDRAASQTNIINYYTESGLNALTTQSSLTSKPYFSGELSVYVPLNFSSGGWNRGLIPQLSYGVTNRVFDTTTYYALVEQNPETGETTAKTTHTRAGKRIFYQNASAALRFYTMMSAAHSEIYPDLGIGVEIGASTSPGLKDYLTSAAYLYAYGYLPGITGNQGLRLTALFRQQLSLESSFFTSERVGVLPRGLSRESGLSQYTALAGSALKLTADYAIPFYMGDFRIWRLFYVSRGILTPHFDISVFGDDTLWSVGASLAIEFGNFFKISFPMQFGLTYSYNGGSLLSTLPNAPQMRHCITPLFNITF